MLNKILKSAGKLGEVSLLCSAFQGYILSTYLNNKARNRSESRVVDHCHKFRKFTISGGSIKHTRIKTNTVKSIKIVMAFTMITNY
jgi:hypothetical protein